jgi:hypothetical protein
LKNYPCRKNEYKTYTLTHKAKKQNELHSHILEKKNKKNYKTISRQKLKIAFRTKNMIQNTLRPQPQTNKYNKCEIYQMKCKGCSMKYVGQTGRTFNTRYKQHIQGGSNMTGTDFFVNKLHCAAAVRPSWSGATTFTLPPAWVRTCLVLFGSC